MFKLPSAITSLIDAVRAFNRNIHYYLLTTLLLGLSVDGVYAVLFNLYLLRLGYNEEVIGLTNSAGLYMFAFGSLASGLFGTRFGSRRMLMVGVISVLIGGTVVPLAQSLPVGFQRAVITFGYMILMGGFATFFVNGSPFMMGSAAPGQRNSVFSIQVATSALAAFGGSLLGGILPGIFGQITNTPLTEPAPYRLPMQLLVVLMVPALLLIRRTTEPRGDLAAQRSAEKAKPQKSTSTSHWRKLPLLLITVIFLIRIMQVAGLGTTATFINVYLDTVLEVPTSRIGLLTSISRLIGVPAALLVPRLTDRYGNIATAIAGSFCAAIFILPVAIIPHWVAAGVGFILARMTTSIRFPSFQVYVMEMFEPRLQSLMAGVMGLAAGLSFATMAFFGGFVITRFGFPTLFLTGASITFLGTIILWLFHIYGKDLIAGAAVPAD